MKFGFVQRIVSAIKGKLRRRFRSKEKVNELATAVKSESTPQKRKSNVALKLLRDAVLALEPSGSNREKACDSIAQAIEADPKNLQVLEPMLERLRNFKEVVERVEPKPEEPESDAPIAEIEPIATPDEAIPEITDEEEELVESEEAIVALKSIEEPIKAIISERGRGFATLLKNMPFNESERDALLQALAMTAEDGGFNLSFYYKSVTDALASDDWLTFSVELSSRFHEFRRTSDEEKLRSVGSDLTKNLEALLSDYGGKTRLLVGDSNLTVIFLIPVHTQISGEQPVKFPVSEEQPSEVATA
jgi:hypothetical protein